MKETALQTTKPLPLTSISEVSTAGDLLAKSGMFGARNPAEGFVIAAMCQQAGLSYIEFMEKYHFFHGRISMRADAMLANLLEHGGSYKIIKRTPDAASVQMKYGAAEGTFSFTWEEALAEPFIYRGGPSEQEKQLERPVEERNIKSKYATPRSRMQMLWARVVSDGVRTVCPIAVSGHYTPEEVSDFGDEQPKPTAAEPEPEPIDVSSRQAELVEDDDANPFRMEEEAESVNYAVCPIPGPLHEKAWSDMPAQHLEMALGLEHPAMTEDHRNEIRSIILEKES